MEAIRPLCNRCFSRGSSLRKGNSPSLDPGVKSLRGLAYSRNISMYRKVYQSTTIHITDKCFRRYATIIVLPLVKQRQISPTSTTSIFVLLKKKCLQHTHVWGLLNRCLHVWMDVSDVYVCMRMCVSLVSHTARWSLLLMGTPVAPPLILLELFPLGCAGWCSSGWWVPPLSLTLVLVCLSIWEFRSGAWTRLGALAVHAGGPLWDLASLYFGQIWNICCFWAIILNLGWSL